MSEVENRVSCQFLETFLIACEDKEVDVGWLLETVDYDRAYFAKRTNLIDWASFVVLVDRCTSQFTDSELFEIAEASFDDASFKSFQLMSRLRFDLFGFYRYIFGDNGPLSESYPLHVEILKSEPLLRNFVVRMSISESLEPSRMFLKIIGSQIKSLSKALGYDYAEVKEEYTDRVAIFDIQLPQETGWWSSFRRAILFPFTIRESYTALQENQETLIHLQKELSDESLRLNEERESSRIVREQLDLVLGNQSILLWTMDMEMATTYVSESVKSYLGYTVEEMLMLPGFHGVTSESQEAALKLFNSYLVDESEGRPFLGTASIRMLQSRKDGSSFWSENYVSFVRNEDGIVQGMVGFSFDVSEIIQQESREESLKQQVQSLRQKEVVSHVAGGIAHDFNNSLQSIMGFAELVLEQSYANPLPEEVIELQDQILKSAGSAAELVKKLLALSSQQTLSRKRTNVKIWLEEFGPMAKSILGRSIKLRIVASDVAFIHVDPLELERAILNLLVNAKDAMAMGGSVTLRCAIVTGTDLAFLSSQDSQASYVEISVEDSGSGISPAHLERVFDPYFTLKDGDSGTGLGLAVTAGIVTQHEGHIQAENLSDGGAAVRMYFPYQNEKASLGRPDETEFTFENLSVLLVDDEDDVRELCRSFLESEGAIVSDVNSGAAAVESAKCAQFDAIVMDVLMPGLTGNQAAKLIKEQRVEQPILFITGFAGSKEVVNDLADEMVLAKPFRKADLISAVRQVVLKPIE